MGDPHPSTCQNMHCLFRGGSYKPGWGSSSQADLGKCRQPPEVRAEPRAEELQAWAWAKGHPEGAQGWGCQEDRRLQRALGDGSYGRGREAL